MAAPMQPLVVPGPQKAPWPGVGAAPGFDKIGWAPEGEVFFRYSIVSAGPASVEWAASAIADLDGDFTPSAYGYIHPAPGSPTVPAAPPNCGATGVYNPAAPAAFDLLNTVGACATPTAARAGSERAAPSRGAAIARAPSACAALSK